MPVGKAGNAANGPDARAVFKVTVGDRSAPGHHDPAGAERPRTSSATGIGDDLIGQYIAQVRQDLGVTINQQALRQATGGEL